MSIGLEDLRDIRAVCEAGSIRRAAEHLGMTQPTLSRRIELMEGKLGAKLFERSRGKSRPTDLALLIAERSAGPLDAAARLDAEVQRFASGKGGTVRMGMGPAPLLGFFECLADRVKRELPDVTLICRTGDTSMLMRHLDQREIDFALCTQDEKMMKPYFQVKLLLSSNVKFISSPGHVLCENPPETLAELFRHPVAMPILESHYREFAINKLGMNANEIPGVVYCSSYYALERMAIAGSHVVLGPPFAFHRALRRGELIANPMPLTIPHELYLFRNRGSLPIAAVRSVLDLFMDEFETLTGKSPGILAD